MHVLIYLISVNFLISGNSV